MRTLTEFDFSHKPFVGKKGRSGAPKGTRSMLKNGSKIRLHRLILGEFPPSMAHIRNVACGYRRVLERQVVDAKGEITFLDAHKINTATAASAAAHICRWLMQHRLEKMATKDIAICSSMVVKNLEKRDAAVRSLNLDAPPPPIWDGLLDANIAQPSEPNTEGDADHDDQP